MVLTTLLPPSDVTGPSDALVLAMARERRLGNPAHRIAAACGKHPSELSRWINGRRIPSAEEARQLAAVLNMDVAEIFPQLEIDEIPGGTPEDSPKHATAGTGRHAQL